MKILLDCLPCMLRQVLEASRMATDDAILQEEIMQEALVLLCGYRSYANCPEIVREIHQIVKRKTEIADPYRAIKDNAIRSALSIYPFLKQYLCRQDDALYWALKIAATGNIIDSAIYGDITVDEGIKTELDKRFAICDIDDFDRKIKEAKTLLIIADNAGETVFDRLLMEAMRDMDITYAVRSEPIINDATEEDAYASGIQDCATIISTGCNAPGTILGECSDVFLQVYRRADIVISKGQANYETLSNADRHIFFLLKAKCPIVASIIGTDTNEYVFMYRP